MTGLLKTYHDRETVFCYYYTTLNKKEQRIYDRLAKGMLSYRTSFFLWNTAPSEVNRIYEKLSMDMPVLFFQNGLELAWNPLLSWVRVKPVYRFGQAEAEALLQEVLRKVEPLLLQCRGKSQLQQELLVHDYLCSTVVYDWQYAKNMGGSSFELAAPLLWGRGVCSGISKAAKFLFDLLEIKSLLLSGKILKNGLPDPSDRNGHMWNMVKIGKDYYHLDITFDITTKSKRYFNMTDQQILADRIIT